jgi:hypothetical protein
LNFLPSALLALAGPSVRLIRPAFFGVSLPALPSDFFRRRCRDWHVPGGASSCLTRTGTSRVASSCLTRTGTSRVASGCLTRTGTCRATGRVTRTGRLHGNHHKVAKKVATFCRNMNNTLQTTINHAQPDFNSRNSRTYNPLFKPTPPKLSSGSSRLQHVGRRQRRCAAAHSAPHSHGRRLGHCG